MNMFTPPGQADEQAWVSRINFEAIELQSRLNYFDAVASTATSAQIQGFLNELHAFEGKFKAWQQAVEPLLVAGRPAAAEQLDGLLKRVRYNLQTYELRYSSRAAWERYQQQQSGAPGWPPAGSPAGPYGPAGGDPVRRYRATMGMCCFWCPMDFGGLPQPVAICPNCGRFPKPPS